MAEKQTDRQIRNIQSLRGVAVILVVVFHIMLMEKKWSAGPRLLSDFFLIGQSGVDLFFIISGFIMVRITQGLGDSGRIRQFLYNRVTRIYPAYWFYSLLLAVLYFFRPELVNPSLGSRVNFAASFLLLPQDLLPLLIVGWTLVYEMYFYLAFALLLCFPRRCLPVLLLAWAAAILIADRLFTDAIPFNFIAAGKVVTSPLTLEFILGCLIALRVRDGGLPDRFSGIAAPAGLLFYAGILMVYYFHPVPGIEDHRVRFLWFSLPFSLMVYGFVALEQSARFRLPEWSAAIGDWSYSIYLSHTLVINGLGWFWRQVAQDIRLPHAAWLLIMFIGSVVCGWISYRLLERPLVSASRKYRQRFLNISKYRCISARFRI